MNITINGKEQPLRLTYEEIITRAGYSPNRVISVTYRGRQHGDMQRSGMLYPGSSVELEDGMVFSAYDTGNA
ncbi:hypothetical protein M0R72_02680 [Candidatus Pacearchaeota archaeon]|jgi:hypothetical protein|nr:hypothetical protein [Candidatus Pacearchaeota archaeon]